MLNDSIKQSIHEIDAFLDGYTLGTLIVEGGQAFLEFSNGEYMPLNDNYQIEVINDNNNHPISCQQAINTLSTDGWSLYAGLTARVKRVTDDIDKTPNYKEMTTAEAINWYTKQVAEVTSAKNRIAGMYSDEYKHALLQCKKELNRKVLEERKSV